MKPQDLEKLNFDLFKSYPHDDWYTHRYQKGVIQVEFTYRADNDNLETVDVTIDEVVGKVLTLEQTKQLDNILNQ